MVSTINRKPWNGGCLIFVVPDKSENALCKLSAYLLSAREELLLCGIDRFNRHLDLLSSTFSGVVKANSAAAVTTDTNRQENGRIMVPPDGRNSYDHICTEAKADSRRIMEKAMTMSGLEAALTATPDVGAPDYSDGGMLQYLRAERIVPPYQTRGYKIVELVRIYEVGMPRHV